MKSKKGLTAIISLVAVLVIGGAIAYYNESTNIKNKLKTGKFQSEVVEKFTPKYDWEPGDKVTKEVGIENTGTGDIVVRAKWSETWATKDGDITITSSDPSGSVVEKEYGNNWIYNDKDGFYYYDQIIRAGTKASDKFLKSIMLSSDVDFAETKTTVVYYSMMTTEPIEVTNDPATGWAIALDTSIPDNSTFNKTVVTGTGKYASANYTLTITVQIYQANKEALTDTNFETTVPDTYAKLN
ncbi:BsaA family SipW-dependent biofilm matrix protein [Thomasclavelia sp.]